MTGWLGIYISKKRQDMLWPDMTWVFIIAYDLWNFCYTYNCLPTHSWYCGIALLLAPTIAGLWWNKGGWIQNRAFTLSMWCMFCQVCPMFANDSIFAVQSVNNPAVNTVVASIALIANIAALSYIIYRSKKLKVNPYKQEVFVGTKDFREAMALPVLPPITCWLLSRRAQLLQRSPRWSRITSSLLRVSQASSMWLSIRTAKRQPRRSSGIACASKTQRTITCAFVSQKPRPTCSGGAFW